MAERGAQTPANEPDNPGGRSRWARLLTPRRLFAGALGIVAVVLVLPGVSTVQAGYYGRYPGLGDRMDHWKTSTHARIGCIDCHVEPGVEGHLMYGIESIPAFYSQLIRGANTTNLLKSPSRKSCQECHTTYRAVSPAGDLLIPHRAHVEVLKMECAACHTDLVHSENRRGFNRPEMELCLEQCHDGDTASDECTACHTRKQTPSSHKSKTWLSDHGGLAKSQDCGQCHDWTPDYCKECHSKRPASHAGNWKKDHASPAKADDSGCIVCHGEKFCKDCH